MAIRVRRRSDGSRAYQVRVDPFPTVTLDTRAAAERVELDLKLKKKLGPLHEEKPTTVGEERTGFLERKRSTRNLRPKSLRWYEDSLKPWAALDHRLVCNLRRREIEDRVTDRAARAPVAAGNELQVLKQLLRQAESRGQQVDQAIYDIPAVRSEARTGRALTVAELYELASWFPEYAKRLVLVAGMVGARQRVWFGLTDRMVDLDAATLTVPAVLAKNRREQVVALTGVETGLLREQLLARARGCSRVFPTKQGRPWQANHFSERVWAKSVKAAARAWRDEHGPGGCPFDGFTFHLLRHTAGSLMALAGFDPAVAALRLGHTDGGALFLTTYRHLYPGEARTHADRLDAFVRAELEAGTGQERDTGGGHGAS